MLRLSALLLCLVAFLAFSSFLVSANWLGPYDTHDEHSLWLRSQMEKTPQKDFILENENDGFSIMNYNAIPNDNSINTSLNNGNAIYNAAVAANASVSSPRVVIIPSGYNFWMIPSQPFTNLINVTFQFNGNMSCNPNNFTIWPNSNTSGGKLPALYFLGGSDIVIVGNNGGSIHGHGYLWWVDEYKKNPISTNRPNLVQFQFTQHVVLDSFTVYDSPRYHIYANPAYAVLIQHVNIEVSIFEQYELQKNYGKMLHEGIDFPTFPLNTDGIDLRGNTIVVRNCHVENFDDAYCPKPWGMNSPEGTTHNILVENSSIHFSLGASIGSVPPSLDIYTIENVTFNRINFENCIKCVYVKPNPGNKGYGLIRDITYKNSFGSTPVWWSIFISTQQQIAIGDNGATGCSFFYPLPDQPCQTQPRVPVQNLILQNMTFDKPLLSPGIMRCNNTFEGRDSGPCTGWQWTNVSAPNSVLKWPFGENFLCHAIENPSFTNVYPSCIENVPGSLSAKSEHRRHLLESLFSSHHHKQGKKEMNQEAKMMLDELAFMMKRSGHSLLNAMKKLHNKY